MCLLSLLFFSQQKKSVVKRPVTKLVNHFVNILDGVNLKKSKVRHFMSNTLEKCGAGLVKSVMDPFIPYIYKS